MEADRWVRDPQEPPIPVKPGRRYWWRIPGQTGSVKCPSSCCWTKFKFFGQSQGKGDEKKCPPASRRGDAATMGVEKQPPLQIFRLNRLRCLQRRGSLQKKPGGDPRHRQRCAMPPVVLEAHTEPTEPARGTGEPGPYRESDHTFRECCGGASPADTACRDSSCKAF